MFVFHELPKGKGDAVQNLHVNLTRSRLPFQLLIFQVYPGKFKLTNQIFVLVVLGFI